MKVLVSGSSGLIGSAAVTHLTAAGHYVIRLVRANPNRERGDVLWDPVAGRIERSKLDGIEAAVHLAGEPILGVWTQALKSRVHLSRVQTTEFLAETLAGLNVKPRVLLSASAVGYYGHRGEQWLDESSAPGEGFLPQLCQEWETATHIAQNAGIRLVNMRIGIVLSAKGGALAKMLPPFRAGLGGRMGSGRQFMSWITLDDLTNAILFAMENERLSGPVNMVSPSPVTNIEFTRAIAHALNRPAFLPVPAFALRLLPGRMAQETMLCSARVEPAKLKRSGFKFEFHDVSQALLHVIGTHR
jgi:uncharacterized protein